MIIPRRGFKIALSRRQLAAKDLSVAPGRMQLCRLGEKKNRTSWMTFTERLRDPIIAGEVTCSVRI
jgi:hypothetical protein